MLSNQQNRSDVLKHQAFQLLINESPDLFFLLDDQLSIQFINQTVCDLFAIDADDLVQQLLPVWFVDHGWVPPVFHFDVNILNASCQTKINLSEKLLVIRWSFEELPTVNPLQQGVLLKGTIINTHQIDHQISTLKSYALSDPSENGFIFKALNDHLSQLTSLASQSLENQDQDAITIKIVMQNILKSIEQTQQLLKFAFILEQKKTFQLEDNQYNLYQILQDMIQKYQSINPSLRLQIALEMKQIQESILLNVKEEVFLEGLNALIMPILNFLDQGKVRIYVSSKASLTQLQIHVNGQDAFGVTIAEWLNQQHDDTNTHKTLYLHWLLGKSWLAKIFGAYQVKTQQNDVVIEMAIPNIPTLQSARLDTSLPTHHKIQQDAQVDPLKQRYNILVVEDNLINQRAVINLVKRLYTNIDITIAESAVEAKEIFLNNRYHLVILDIGLPDCSDLAVALDFRCQEREANLTPVPICILSAHYKQADYLKECPKHLVHSLVQNFYAKPLSAAMLAHMIDSWIEHANKTPLCANSIASAEESAQTFQPKSTKQIKKPKTIKAV